MTTSHTPGPWVVLPEECDKAYIRIRGTQLGGRYKIANIITPVYDGVLPREGVETRANARLISAAPELLSALQSALEFIDSQLFAQRAELQAQCRAAIAKATA
jgi:hypothetical protein